MEIKHWKALWAKQLKTVEKKRAKSKYGDFSINKQHKWFAQISLSTTPYMQHLVLIAGQNDNYRASEEYLKCFLRIDIDDSQICRICQVYGTALDPMREELQTNIEDRGQEVLKGLENDEVVYAMLDGCYIPTRPEEESKEKTSSWREMKLGRVFSQKSHLKLSIKPNWIRESLYVAHFGKHNKFCDKFERVIDVFEPLDERLVFITDGASWIEKWIQACYPNATNILDFFHAIEYLHKFSRVLFPSKKEEKARNNWISQQKMLLLNDRVQQVIQEIESKTFQGKVKQEAQQKVLSYYKNNQHRMAYKTYRDRGLLIGSGPIESAHRFVLQKRMKQSGQKWTIYGGQAIANLRVAYLNKQWDSVIELICSARVA